jgi:hypothetical protein
MWYFFILSLSLSFVWVILVPSLSFTWIKERILLSYVYMHKRFSMKRKKKKKSPLVRVVPWEGIGVILDYLLACLKAFL